jgi:hypothetical protein
MLVLELYVEHKREEKIMSIDYLGLIITGLGLVMTILTARNGGLIWGMLGVICWIILLFTITPDYPLTSLLFLGLISVNVISIIKGGNNNE